WNVLVNHQQGTRSEGAGDKTDFGIEEVSGTRTGDLEASVGIQEYEGVRESIDFFGNAREICPSAAVSETRPVKADLARFLLKIVAYHEAVPGFAHSKLREEICKTGIQIPGSCTKIS